MRNIVGQTPRGEDFFPRDNIIRRICRRLDSGANVYLAASRRGGKTAIMRHLEDRPREGYEFKYIITEAVDDAAAYFKRLLDALHTLKKLSTKSFDDSEYRFVLALLDELTRSDELSRQQVKEFADTHGLDNYGIVLRTLEFDGYIFASEAFYRFTSPVLRLWWRNYVKQ